MSTRHVGVRPLGKLTRDEEIRRNTYYEETESGYRIWNDKLLNSGCGKTVDIPERYREATEGMLQVSEDISLLWCPHCREWANQNQFIGDDNES